MKECIDRIEPATTATPGASSSTVNSIEDLRALIASCLHIPDVDLDLIDFCLAVYKSNEIPGDPLWAIIIDASGGGKTEILRAFRPRPDAYFLSKLTEKTLVSGYRDPTNRGKDPSILPELNNKVLIIKDLAPLLSMRQESRNAIISDLRDAYDGFTDQGKGNVGKVAYESRFTLLSASTLAIERTNSVDQELGERFVKFRARGDLRPFSNAVASSTTSVEFYAASDCVRWRRSPISCGVKKRSTALRPKLVNGGSYRSASTSVRFARKTC
jgi:hypothetical protein